MRALSRQGEGVKTQQMVHSETTLKTKPRLKVRELNPGQQSFPFLGQLAVVFTVTAEGQGSFGFSESWRCSQTRYFSIAMCFTSRGEGRKKRLLLQRGRPQGWAGPCELLRSCRVNPAIATFITGGEHSTLNQFGISSSQLVSFH